MDTNQTVGPDRHADALCTARVSMQRVLIHGLADEAEVVRALLYTLRLECPGPNSQTLAPQR